MTDVSVGGATCPGQLRQVRIWVYRVFNNTVINYVEFNIGSGQTTAQYPTYGPGMLNPGFGTYIAGEQYKFVVETQNAKSTLRIWRDVPVGTYINKKVGGLRLKKITDKDGLYPSRDVVRTFKYEQDGDNTKSSGVLFAQPAYGFTYDANLPNSGIVAHLASWKSTSITPMGNFEGYHIGYKRVVEEFNGNGKTIYTFLADELPSPYSYNFPSPPEPVRVRNSNVSTTQVANAANAVVSSSSITPRANSYFTFADQPVKGLKILVSPVCYGSGWSGSVTAYLVTPYSIRTGIYQVESKIETTDGVSTQTTYGYQTAGQYLFPKTITTKNSDQVTQVVDNTYPADVPVTAFNYIPDSLTIRNIINHPVETKILVNGVQVDGTKTEWRFFDATGPTSLPSIYLYPWKFSRYEQTWNSAGTLQTGVMETQSTVDQYYIGGTAQIGAGYPLKWTKANWPSEIYEWELGGLLKKRTYQGFVKEYTWIPSTRLLQQSKGVDGQIVTYSYDMLGRLIQNSSRGGNVSTLFSYKYKDPALGIPVSYVKSQTSFFPVSGSGLTTQEVYQYVDGLGRSIQTVGKMQSPAQKDVVSTMEYDAWGRVSKVYNPFETSTNTGAYVTSVPGGTPFTLSEYYTDPLNRIWKTTPPTWYATTAQYGTNVANEVKLNHAAATYYNANTLLKTTVTDPDGRQSITFKDLKGRTILVKRTDGTNTAETYSQYDDKDRPKLVIPPGALYNSTDLTFAYTYDGADNMLTKKMPDAALVTMKYNDRDQLALEQDGNLLSLNKWRCTQYDDYGRLIKTGLFAGTIPSPLTATLAPTDVYTENTYDGTLPIEKGKLKKSRVKEFDVSGTWLETNLNYDAYGRVSYTTESNHLLPADLSSEVIYYTYDFADHVLTDTRTSKKTASASYVITQTHLYDQWGRLVTNRHKVNSGAEVTVSDLNYNWKNELIEKNLGKTAGGSYLQSLDYGYNAQGWLQTINQPTLNTGSSVVLLNCPTNYVMPNPAAGANPDANDLFYLDLKYDALQSGLIGTSQKNGNVSQVIWRTRGRERQSYSLTYDFLDRMKTASYADITDAGVAGSANQFQENLTYDARGNILTLQRNGQYKTIPTATCWTTAQIDNLTYTYLSGTNRLQRLVDNAPAASKASGWNNTANATVTDQLLYDINGNLATDPYKGMVVLYNYLNLPVKFTFTGNKVIDVLYDGAGRKLRKTVTDNGVLQYKQDYVNGIEYRTTTTVTLSLESIYYSEGRVFNTYVGTTSADALRYEYSIKDHQGNTRLTFTDKNGDGTIQETNTSANEVLQENHYYPFGMSMSGPWMDDATAPDNQYLYNGKELNADFGLGLYDYGARWYDAATGRWWSVDPLAAKYQSASPYNYVVNNPIRLIDPNGKSVIVPLGANENGGKNTKQYQEQIFRLLQSLTNDQLGWSTDKEGRPIVLVVQKSKDGKLTFGTGLVRFLTSSGSKNIFIGAPKPGEGNLTYSRSEQARKTSDGTPGAGAGSVIRFDPNEKRGGINIDGNEDRSPKVGFAHELIHAAINLLGQNDDNVVADETVRDKRTGKLIQNKVTKTELDTRHMENEIRYEQDEPPRIILPKGNDYEK